MSRTDLAAICFFLMALMLVLSYLSFTGGIPRAGAIELALGSLFMAAGATLARGK